MRTLFYGSELALQGRTKRTFSPDELKMALTQIQGPKALQGITGRISFDRYGDPTDKVFFVLQVDDNKLHIVDHQGCFSNCQPVR